jgi:hypothetical protein
VLRLTKFGVFYSRKKLDALLRGDKSSTVLHRSFVCGAEALGFPAFTDDTPTMVLFYARQIQTAWESLAGLFKVNDYRAKLHGGSTVVPGFIYLHMPRMALLYIQKCYKFIQAGTCNSFRPMNAHQNYPRTSTKSWLLFPRPCIGQFTRS